MSPLVCTGARQRIETYPVLIHELAENAVNSIYNDSFDRALVMLMKAQQLLDQLCVGKCRKSPVMSLLISHNLALCYQKAGQLPECGACLKQCLIQVKKMVTQNDSQGTKFKHLKYLSKVHMQYCAILSQQNKHTDALDHAKYGVKYSHEMITQTMHVAEGYASHDGSTLLGKPIVGGEAPELAELFSRRLLPVLRELVGRFVTEATHSKSSSGELGGPPATRPPGKPAAGLDVRNLFGYMQSSDWISSLNIGNIMQISPITLQDVETVYDLDVELTRETLLEKVALLAVSYFCISTEKRFLAQSDSGSARQSEFWHAKALEIACCFLPAECPLVTHVFSSYQKHHSPLQQAIVSLQANDS